MNTILSENLEMRKEFVDEEKVVAIVHAFLKLFF